MLPPGYDPAFRPARGKEKDGKVEDHRGKMVDKAAHRRIIHGTCPDNVQKPDLGLPGPGDTCMKEAAAGGTQSDRDSLSALQHVA